MSYSIDSITDDCYEGTTCLVNKFGIKNESNFQKLKQILLLQKQVN